MNRIKLINVSQNNLKRISVELPKNKLIVFTGVSGSGKSSLVFDTIAAEAVRQMNETYSAFIRNRLPKYEKPHADLIENLSPAVVVDQTALGSNARSTVGTASELYTGLRILFSRIGQPYAGPASSFSFNDPSGMCHTCSGLGTIMDINLDRLLDTTKSWTDGPVRDTLFRAGSWYWKLYAESGLFDVSKPLREYRADEMNLLLYGSREKDGTREREKIDGVYNCYKHRYLTRDTSVVGEHQKEKSEWIVTRRMCPECSGHRLNRISLACWINGLSIADMCEMELPDLRRALEKISDPRIQTVTATLISSISRLIDIGLPYLSLNRDTSSLSGGEAQRLKLVRFLGSGLSDMMYIFDEPSTGLHPRDVHRMNQLMTNLRDRGNTVIVVEHDRDVISIADEIIDIGPFAGCLGGEIVFQGTYNNLLSAETLTSKALKTNIPLKTSPRKPSGYLPVRGASLNNLKNVDVDIPLGVICAITGVAGSGKSSLISGVFAELYADKVVLIDQSPITATSRSTPSSFLGFFDTIRKLFADANGVSEGLFSFNSEGACPDCKGKGVIITELVFMDPVESVCERCGGKRYSDEALALKYHGKNILEVLSMTVSEASEFFDHRKINKSLKALSECGLSYMTLGQPLSTLSGGERQRLKLAKHLGENGSVYIMDEPTTGLHSSDCAKLMDLFETFTVRGNTVLIIEHNIDVMKRSDYIIDVGPDGGRNGGEIVFFGTPAEMVEKAETMTAVCLRAAVENRDLSEEERKILLRTAAESQKETKDMKIQMTPIGRIETKDDETEIVLDTKYAPALDGLNEFSHLQIYWWFDGCDTLKDRSVLTNITPYNNGPKSIGTFATRSPQRPNPIALTTAKILWIDNKTARIGISFIDARDGTPVVDIKPYTPSLDRVENPSVPAWCAEWPRSLEQSADFDWSKIFT